MVEGPRIIPVNIEEEVSASYIDYAMSVIVGRALPDVRDGLKPVHRRILFAMYEQSNTYNRAHKKSARIVGDVIGKYHPHGDQAVYAALARMAQDFNMRVPLVDGQGNFGSVDGDPPAAMRYTEVRMTRITNEMLGDIEKDTVNYTENYDGSEQEPDVMPARWPNLLVNGSEGIAVGMATKIPPHNLREVVDATIHLVRNPEATVRDLMQFVQGPDFPTGGIIYGTSGFEEAYHTGRGVVRIRAVARIEHDEKRDRSSIIVDELPYQVNKARLLEKIGQLVRDKRIDGISDLRDESDRRGMRMVIECKRDAIPEIVLNKLYKMTLLQSSFGIILLAIVGGRPETLSLREVLNHFIDFRRDVVTRRTRFELRKALDREHILLGLTIALDHLDAVIKLIRNSANPDEARDGLMTSFGLSRIQAQAILDMRLQRLTGLERQKIQDELAEIQTEIARLRAILADEVLLLNVIVGELEAVRDAHANDRRTEIRVAEGELSLEDLIADEEVVVTITHAGYIKRTAVSIYRAQRRGGKGRTGMTTRDEDFIEDVFVTTTHSTLMIFTTAGRVFQLKVHQLPEGGPTTRGRPIVNLITLEGDELMACVLPISNSDEHDYIVASTEGGSIKRTHINQYANIYSRGIIAVKLREGDHLNGARLCNEEDRMLLVTRVGKCIQFEMTDVSPTGRDTMGVRGIRLDEGDKVVSMSVIHRTEGEMLTITENGFGKRTVLDDYPVQGRGGKGVITIKTSDRNGAVVGTRLVEETDEFVMVTNTGKIIRTRVADVPVIGRNTQGVRLMRTETDEIVAGIALLSERGLEEEGEDGDAPAEEGAAGTEEGAAGTEEGAGAEAQVGVPAEASDELKAAVHGLAEHAMADDGDSTDPESDSEESDT